MNGFDYFKHVLINNYANFSGRARRSEYWYFALFYFVTSLVLTFLLSLITISESFAMIVVGIFFIYYAAMFIPSLAVGVRRLHDTDKSGWFLLLGFIPLVGPIILIIFFATEGTPGRNQYGQNPKETLEPDMNIEDQLV